MRMIINNAHGNTCCTQYTDHDGTRTFIWMDDWQEELAYLRASPAQIALAGLIVDAFTNCDDKIDGYNACDAWNALIGFMQGCWLGPDCFIHDIESVRPGEPSCWTGAQWAERFMEWPAFEFVRPVFMDPPVETREYNIILTYTVRSTAEIDASIKPGTREFMKELEECFMNCRRVEEDDWDNTVVIDAETEEEVYRS